MWLLSFAMLAVILHGRPDGHKLPITTDHRRDPDLARTAPLPLADHSGPMYRTDAETRTNRIVPGSGETHRSATDPSNPDPTSHLKYKTSITNAQKLSSAPPPDAQAAPPHRRRPLPRPPGAGPPGHHAVADPKAPRSGGHATSLL